MTTAYATTIADVKNRLSDVGVSLRQDDDQDGSVSGSGTESTAYSSCYTRAAAACDFYLRTHYTSAQLATHQQATEWCTTLAAFFLCSRRGQIVPESLQEQKEEAVEQMKAVHDGAYALVDLQPQSYQAPSWGNPRIDQRYPYRKVRVQTPIGPDKPTPQHTQATEPPGAYPDRL